MILVLTYHKVVRGPEEHPEFYSIRAEQLERHIELLHEKNFRILPPGGLLNREAQSGSSCVLTFDDGTLDHFEVVKPVLERLSCRGLFFVPTARLDQAGKLSSDQVRELGASGHTIGSHSHEHARLDRLPEEDIRVQLEVSQQKVAQLIGTPALFFAPPGGFYNPLIRNIALETGFSVIRTMRWGYNRHLDLAELECVPINRFLTESDFCRLLSGRNMQLAYQAKQMTKRLVPDRVYGQLRSVVFGLTGRN